MDGLIINSRWRSGTITPTWLSVSGRNSMPWHGTGSICPLKAVFRQGLKGSRQSNNDAGRAPEFYVVAVHQSLRRPNGFVVVLADQQIRSDEVAINSDLIRSVLWHDLTERLKSVLHQWRLTVQTAAMITSVSSHAAQ